MVKKAGGAAKLLFDEEEQADGLGGLFGDEEPAQAASEKIGAAEAEGGKKVEKQLSTINPNECKILGYILMTKPASLNVMDPVTVGCIFLNGSTKKYFLRVIKLTFSINYLQNFISIDTNSGRLINKINGKQLLTIDDIHTQNLEILNHQETIFDLTTVFMRTQVVKKDWPRKDHKFSIFDELSEAEIEIEDCTRIIDFTRCTYSVQASDWVHVIYEKTDSTVNLVQYRIVDDIAAYDSKLMVTPIYLDQGKELKLEEAPARVFQVDDKIVILGAQSYQVYRITDYFPLATEKLC